jgi:hypothetical protein
MSSALCLGGLALTSLRSREAHMFDNLPDDLGINDRTLPTKPTEQRMTTEKINGSWNASGASINLCESVRRKKRWP